MEKDIAYKSEHNIKRTHTSNNIAYETRKKQAEITQEKKREDKLQYCWHHKQKRKGTRGYRLETVCCKATDELTHEFLCIKTSCLSLAKL